MAYPPPIAEISSKTAVARADAARETFGVDALRPDIIPLAERTTFDDAARPTDVCADVAVDRDAADRGVLTPLRDVTVDEFVFFTFDVWVDRPTVTDGRRIAERETFADGTTFVVAFVRRTSRPSVRAVDTTDVVPRGFGAWSA